MNKNSNVYQSVKIMVDDKLTEMNKSVEFKNAVVLKYLDAIAEVVEEAINNELEYLAGQSKISGL